MHQQQRGGGDGQDAADKGGIQAVDGAPDPVRFPAAEGLGDDHGAAGGDAGEQGGEQEDHRKADAHGGQGSVADKVAHHPAIHHIVELLQKIPRQQRQGKHQNMAEGTARRHIPDSAFRPHDTPLIIFILLYSFSPERAS